MTVVADFPPGSRVRVRDEEWMVEKSLPLRDGGVAVHVQGLTDLVRHHKAVFLNEIDEITLLNPEDTRLVADDSPGYRRTRLFIETLLRRTPPTDELLRIGHHGALDVLPYQLFPAYKALSSARTRILIADGTGLGKTVEVGILLSELVKRGRGRRILVVAIKSMLAQLQRELWARFTLPLVRLDSEGLLRVQQKIPSNRNPFSYFDRCILSVDTLKNNARYRAWLEEISWDAIVVDECHNVSNKGSQRAQLARLLAAKCDTLILTSATPHNGRPESFANLMRMLDPTAIADEQHFEGKDIAHLYVRRFKKDLEGAEKNSLQDREIHRHEANATPAEEDALAELHQLKPYNLGRKSVREDRLLRWALVKAFLSSPDAALETIDERIKNTESALKPHTDGPHPNHILLNRDLRRLHAARAKVELAASEQNFSKLRRLIQELRAIKFTGKPDSPRVVIFSERIATLELLEKALPREFGISNPESVIGKYDASSQLSEKALRDIQESFGRANSPMRLLLASDAASEGVNLHYHCSQLFHFDIPWSLIRLTQRNGRIDRYGQKHTPHLHYLMTCTRAETADQHVMKRLVEKENAATRQLGDVAELLRLYDPDSEDRHITEGLAKGLGVSDVLPDEPLAAGFAAAAMISEDDDDNPVIGTALETPDDGNVDLLALLERSDPHANVSTDFGGDEPSEAPSVDLTALLAEQEKADAKVPPRDQMEGPSSSLFTNDYAFAVAALRHLEKHPVAGDKPLSWEYDDKHQIIRVDAPEPFCTHREPFLPTEAIPEKGTYQLVQSREEVATRLLKALEDDGSWPEWHLLWEQHPLMDWMLDALAASYARLEAPVLRIRSLDNPTALFLMHAMHYNIESKAVYANWFAIEVHGVEIKNAVVPFDELVKRVGLVGELVNTGHPSARMKALEALVGPAIRHARDFVKKDRQKANNAMQKRILHESQRVDGWYKDSTAAIERRRAAYATKAGGLPALLDKKLTEELRNVERNRKNHQEWLDSLHPAGSPYVRLVAVFSGE